MRQIEVSNGGRVLVIGLDAITWDLLAPWIEAGKLPNLARLRREGSRSVLLSTIVPGSAPAWSSFITGKGMGKHGVFQFVQPKPGSYDVQFINGSHVRGKSLWRLLSEAGKWVVVINVPMTFPAENVNGYLIAGMDAPGISPGFTHPPDLLRTIEPVTGKYILEPGMWGYISQGRQDEALAKMHEAIEQRFRVVQHLMRTEPWDFFMVVFTASDRVQHFFWKYMDSIHPQHDAGAPAAWRDAILECYQHLDRIVGELRVELQPGDNVIICSDHGAGPIGDRSFYLNQWLAEKGFLAMHETGGVGLAARVQQWVLSNLRKSVRRFFSRPAKERLMRCLPRLRDRVEGRLLFSRIDWTRTQAYALEGEPLIYINLKGRHPQGIVEPEQYDTVRQQIIDELQALRDPWEGWPIAQAKAREEVFRGEALDEAPDIAVFLRHEYTSRMTYTYSGGGALARLSRAEMERLERYNHPNAVHRREGVLLACGSAFKHGFELPSAEISDLAPTILHLFGLPVPEDMDGRVLSECLMDARPVRYTAAEAAPLPGEEALLDEEEAALIRQRLEGLGYLGN